MLEAWMKMDHDSVISDLDLLSFRALACPRHRTLKAYATITSNSTHIANIPATNSTLVILIQEWLLYLADVHHLRIMVLVTCSLIEIIAAVFASIGSNIRPLPR